MSRQAVPWYPSLTRFPRVSGDEPGPTSMGRTRALFSPRERG